MQATINRRTTIDLLRGLSLEAASSELGEPALNKTLAAGLSMAANAVEKITPEPSPGSASALQKMEPLDQALDLLALKMEQLLRSDDPDRFPRVERLCQLTQAIRQEMEDPGVEDFPEEGDGGYGVQYVGGAGRGCNPRRRNFQAGRNMGAGAGVAMQMGAPYRPYGMGEDPGGGAMDVNDLYRELLSVLGPAMEVKAKESASGILVDRARELDRLVNARKGMADGELDTSEVDQRIQALTKEIATGAPEGDDQESPEGPPESKGKNPDCVYCQSVCPPMLRDGRLQHHLGGDEWDDCPSNVIRAVEEGELTTRRGDEPVRRAGGSLEQSFGLQVEGVGPEPGLEVPPGDDLGPEPALEVPPGDGYGPGIAPMGDPGAIPQPRDGGAE